MNACLERRAGSCRDHMQLTASFRMPKRRITRARRSRRRPDPHFSRTNINTLLESDSQHTCKRQRTCLDSNSHGLRSDSSQHEPQSDTLHSTRAPNKLTRSDSVASCDKQVGQVSIDSGTHRRDDNDNDLHLDDPENEPDKLDDSTSVPSPHQSPRSHPTEPQHREDLDVTSGEDDDIFQDTVDNEGDATFLFDNFPTGHIDAPLVGTEGSAHICTDEQRTTSNTSARATASDILKSMKSFLTRPTLLGIISLYGQPRLTLAAYDHLVAMMKDNNSTNTLPSSTTMRQRVLPKLLQHNFVPSSIKSFKTTVSLSSECSDLSSTVLTPSRDKTEQAVLVLPSEWAKMDIRSLHVLREITCVNTCRCFKQHGASDIRFETTPSVSSKSRISSKSDFLWTNNEGIPTPATTGATIKLSFSADPSEMTHFPEINVQESVFRGESCYAFTASLIATEHVVHSIEKSTSIEHGLRPQMLPFHMQNTYNEALSYLQGVCTKANDCSENTTDFSSERAPDRNPVTLLNGNGSLVEDIFLLPGDHLSILSVTNTSYVAVFVSRFWVRRLSDERNFVIMFSSNSNGELRPIGLTTLGAPALIIQGRERSQQQESPSKCYTTGFLPSGKRFYKYRILIYADDFTPRSSLFPKGSVGGLYMSPSGFSVRLRKSQCTIRVISLTPTGVSTNVVFEYIINDIVTGSTSGIESVDAYGNEVIIFLDISGFIGDYPASSAAVDLKGHTASVPCTHCIFPRQVLMGSSMYSYSTVFHSGHSAFRRSQKRAFSVRSFGLSKSLAKNLGMKFFDSTDKEQSGKHPLIKLADSFNLTIASDNSLSDILDLHPLDGYDLNIVAPEHLLTGLFKGILCLCFIHLPEDEIRQKLSILIRAQVLEHGFQTQSTLFKKGKLVPGLSMSTLYCILASLPAALQSIGQLQSTPIRSMLLHLHRFTSLAFWRPSLHTDGETAWAFVHGDNIYSYHHLLQRIAANFAKAVHKYCKSYPSLAGHIDRPNVHRLLELAIHTIPNYNHLCYICELVYESAHQPLKYFLSRNHTSGSHLNALHHILAKDWLVRVWCLWRIHTSTTENDADKQFALICLIYLFAGSNALSVDWNSLSSSDKDILDELRTYIHSLLTGTVENRLEKWYTDYASMTLSESKWILQYPPDLQTIPSSARVYFHTVLQLFATVSIKPETSLRLYTSAALHRGYGSKTLGSHERLKIGDVVQVLLPADFKQHRFLHELQSSSGSPNYFAVCAFFKEEDGTQWVNVKHCKTSSSAMTEQIPNFNADPLLQVSIPPLHSAGISESHFFQLNTSIKKVGVLHDCTTSKGCKFSARTKSVIHSTTTVLGGHFFLLIRSMGYPPRRS